MRKLTTFILSLLTIIGINEVNNCCFLIFGQEKESASLEKYKKYK